MHYLCTDCDTCDTCDMGGYGSGGHNRKRITVEACARLDIAMIRRAGLLDCVNRDCVNRDCSDKVPPKPYYYYWTYSSRGRRTCVAGVIAGAKSNEVTLVIVTPDRATHTQQARVTYTDCNYGGRRAWLHCPYCGRRVFRLFYYDNTYSAGVKVHRFMCRHCYGLTYDGRRERGFDRYQSRAMNVKSKLKAWAHAHGQNDYGDDDMWDMPPAQPKGMRLRTYDRLFIQWQEATTLAQVDWMRGASRLLGRSQAVDELLAAADG